MWEATGFAMCFQNHTDYDKLDIKHCLVLSWVKAQGGGAEFTRTLPSVCAVSYVALHFLLFRCVACFIGDPF